MAQRWTSDTCSCVIDDWHLPTAVFVQQCPAHLGRTPSAVCDEQRNYNFVRAAVLAQVPADRHGEVRVRFTPGQRVRVTTPMPVVLPPTLTADVD